MNWLCMVMTWAMTQGKPAAEELAPAPKLVEDAEAKSLLAKAQKNLQSREPRLRKEALEVFQLHQHESFVKELTPFLRDKDPIVACAALQAVSAQPVVEARKALLQFLKQERTCNDPVVGTQAIKSLVKVGYGDKGYEHLRQLFESACVEVKYEMLTAFGKLKEKKAFSLFVDLLEEPAPENVDHANNPPADYWRAKWDQWERLRTPVRKGIDAITEQKFAKAQDYKDWAKKDGRRLGFVYEKGK